MFYWLEMTNRCGFENGVIKMSLKGGMFFLAGKKGGILGVFKANEPQGRQ